jgi:hypothetical protein
MVFLYIRRTSKLNSKYLRHAWMKFERGNTDQQTTNIAASYYYYYYYSGGYLINLH